MPSSKTAHVYKTKPKASSKKQTASARNFPTIPFRKRPKRKIARLQTKKDRAQQKVEKFKNENRLSKLQNQANQKLDSLNPQNKLNQPISKVEHLTDSLVPTLTVPSGQLTRYQQKVDSVQGRLSAKVDSLRNFKLPEIRFTKSMDSLKQKKDSPS